MNRTVLILLVSIVNLVCANEKSDSLYVLLKKQKASYNKALLNLELAKQYKSIGKDSAYYHAVLGKKMAKQLKHDSLLAALYFETGHIYDFVEDYNHSLGQYKFAIKYGMKCGDTLITGRSAINAGATYMFYEEFDSAIYYYKIALEKFMLQKDSIHLSKIYNNIGLMHKYQGNYIKATNTFLECLNIHEACNNIEGVANVYQNLGIIYWEQGNNKEAIGCYEKAAEYFKQIDDKTGMADIYSNLALIYNAQNDTALALRYFDEAEILHKQTKNNYRLGIVYSNRALIYHNNKNIELAERDYLKALELFEQLNYSKGITACLLNYGALLTLKEDYSEAIKILLQAEKLVEEQENLNERINMYKSLSTSYAANKNFNQAYHYFRKYDEIRDTLMTIDKNKQINEIITRYETEKKENQINILQKDSQIKQLNIDKKGRQIRYYVFLIIIISASIVILIILYFQKISAYKTIVKKNVELTKRDLENEWKSKQDHSVELKKTKSDGVKLDNNQVMLLKKEIERIMETEKPYLNTQFTINDLAKKVNSNRFYVSQVINTEFSSKFNHFINMYRIREARKLLIDPDFTNYSLEGIALQVGFHSRATFNTSFKRITGVTPSFFQKNSHYQN